MSSTENTRPAVAAIRALAADLSAGIDEQTAAVAAVRAGAPVIAVAAVYGVAPSTVRRWAAS